MNVEVLGQILTFYAGLFGLAMLVEFAKAVIWAAVFYAMFKRLGRDDR